MPNKSTLDRVKMQDSRSGLTRKTVLDQWELYVTVNFFENGQPGEVFVTVGKNGTTVSGLMQMIATQFSMLLQVGVPAAKICEKMRHHKFEPRNEKYSSIVDALAGTILEACSDWGSVPDLDHRKKEVKW